MWYHVAYTADASFEELRYGFNGHLRCVVRETSNTAILDTSDLNIEKIVGDVADQHSSWIELWSECIPCSILRRSTIQ